jgi:hypothetical protein
LGLVNSRLRTIPFLFVLPVALGVVGLVLAIALWQQGVLPWVEGRLSRSTGHKAKIGSLVPHWRRLEARNVVVFGAAPFDAVPLARIGRLEIELGGSLLSPVATRITAESALVSYLAIGLGQGAVDNVRGVPGAAPQVARAAGGSAVLELKDSRFEAHIRVSRLADSPVALRAEGLTARRGADGALTSRWEGAVLDVPGWATVRLPRFDLVHARGEGRLSARDVSVSVPGGGALLAPLALQLTSGPAGLVLSCTPASPGGSAGRLTAQVKVPRGGHPGGELKIERLPLPALRPLLARLGVTVTHGVGDLSVTLPASEGDSALAGSASVSVRHLDVHHPRLDRAPWRGISLAARARGSYDVHTRTLALDDGELTALGLATRITGQLGLSPLTGNLRLQPAAAGPTSCADVLGEWPAAVREKLAGLAVSGKVGLRAHVTFDERTWDELGLGIAFNPLCEVTAEPTAISRLDPRAPAEQLIAGAVAPLGVAAADVVTLRQLPPHVVGAFLTAEDAAFRKHDGLDAEMIRRAIAHDLAMGSLSKGASTLTQQVVKNLFLSPERTLGRKLAELVLTWRIEHRLDKDRILELYLNAVELGPGIRGLGRAAATYFGKPAAQLTPLEAAHLAALLPNPIGFARRFRDGRVDDGWMLKLLDLLGRMRRGGVLSQASLTAARGSALNLRKF